MKTLINNKTRFCFIGLDGKPHLVFSIKWDKGNLYFINESHVENFKTKISYHTPRPPSGKSQVNFKINDRRPSDQEMALCCPIQEIKGVRRIGGSGVPIEALTKLPIRNGKDDYILDVRPFHLSHLSTIQWYWFLVEPEKINLLKEDPMIKEESRFTEKIQLFVDTGKTPNVAILFERIRDENSIWYKK